VGHTRDDFLASVPLFASLSPGSLEKLRAQSSSVRVRAGEHLFHQGDPSDGMYLVSSGRLEVILSDPGPVVAREVGRGAVLGELGLLSGAPRSSSIRAKRDSELVRIDKDHFTALLEEAPGFAVDLARALGRQLQASRGLQSEASPLPTAIAIVALSPGVSAGALGERLSDAMGRFGAVAVVRSGQDDAADEATFARLVDDQERRAGRVLLVAEPGDSPSWHDFCTRQADRVLALVSRRDPVPEAPLDRRLRNSDLVNCETPGAGSLDPWLDALQPRAVYSLPADVRTGSGVDVMARRLAGRSLGLVMAGGGARGSAHIGVLEGLAEAGVVVDRVVGCSIGALAAAAFATGMSTEEMARGWHRDMIATNPLNDYTLPAVSIVRGAKLRQGLRNQFGSTRIEDLPREFFCVSSDIHTGELYVHRRGPLVDAIFASMCIPGLLPPARVDGRVLVDGGLLNNLPVNILAARGEGPVIASNLSVQSGGDRSSASPAPRRRTRRWEAMVQGALTGSEAPALRLRETLMRALLLGSVDATRAAREKADVVVTPDTQGIALLDFAALDRGIAAGREAVREALAEPEARRRLLLD
jgi:NTE family protein